MPTYPNAPITEAVIAINVDAIQHANAVTSGAVWAGLEPDYPVWEPLTEVAGQISLDAQKTISLAARAPAVVGQRFFSVDGLSVAQAKLDGFIFSRLKPYQRWETFSGEARRLWSLYRERAQPERIVRLAIRNINQIEIPAAATIDLEDYFHIYPEFPGFLTDVAQGFFLQLRTGDDQLGASATINQAIVEASAPDKIAVVLDIDLFCQDELPEDDEEIWNRLESLRHRKNEIFESCITERTRELFR